MFLTLSIGGSYGGFADDWGNLHTRILSKMTERAEESAKVLQGAAQEVLQGSRSGRIYPLPGGGYYQASAPGEPPAKKTGAYRTSFVPKAVSEGGRVIARIESGATADTGANLGKTLENMNRPHKELIQAKAWPEVRRIFSRAYLGTE